MKYVCSLVLIFCLGFSLAGLSQSPVPVKISGSVRGTIVDSVGKQDMSDATVSVMPLSDSSDVQYVSTDRKGSFLMKNLGAGNYSLLISFQGFQHIRKTFTI